MSELAAINPQLIFKKKEGDENTLSVKAIAADKSVVYFLEAPKDYFAFESNSLSVIDFNRLVSYYNVFNNPDSDPKKNEVPEMSIEYNNDNESVVLHIKSSLRNANLKHKLANEDVITKPTFSKVKFPSVDAIVNMTEDQQKTINARLKLIGADRMKYAFSGDTLTLTLFTTKTGDTYAEDYKLAEAVSEDFELVTPATGFALLPVGNFNVYVSKAGIMEFKQLRDDAVDLSLYIAKAKND
jgi:hypothetical protein